MRPHLLLALLAASAGFSLAGAADLPAQAAKTPAAKDAPASKVVESGTYAMSTKGRTVMLEHFTRTADHVEGRLVVGTRTLVAYVMTLGSRAQILALRIDLEPGSMPGDSAGMYILAGHRKDEVSVTYRDESMRMDQTFDLPDGVQLGISGSIVFLEQMVRRARALGKSSQPIPIFLPVNRQDWQAVVTPAGSDSVWMALSGEDWRFKTDADGRILGGQAVSSSIAVARLARKD